MAANEANVTVPQTFVSAIAPGLSTDTVVPRVPYDGGVLRPGMYADVKFHVARADPPWLVPSTAIIIRSGAPQIAVVRADGVVPRRG